LTTAEPELAEQYKLSGWTALSNRKGCFMRFAAFRVARSIRHSGLKPAVCCASHEWLVQDLRTFAAPRMS
jgi:hypothetical protein